MIRHGASIAFAAAAAGTPIGHVGAPSEIAAVAAFLASSDSSFMTGSEVFADGGLPRDPIPDHLNLLDAIVDGDPQAARAAMRVLVDLALEDMRESME